MCFQLIKVARVDRLFLLGKLWRVACLASMLAGRHFGPEPWLLRELGVRQKVVGTSCLRVDKGLRRMLEHLHRILDLLADDLTIDHDANCLRVLDQKERDCRGQDNEEAR